MKRRNTCRQPIDELARIRREFNPASATRKLELVRRLQKARISSVTELLKYHDTLCYLRAFPDSEDLFRVAHESLTAFEDRVKHLPRSSCEALWDTGIGGTPVHYSFSYEVASWLARNTQGEVSIDWDDVDDDTTRLDDLLLQILLPAEEDYFDGGYITSREWVDTASSQANGTDFDWLFAQLHALQPLPVLSQLYDWADIPLAWNLTHSSFSKSRNNIDVSDLAVRAQGMRRAGRNTKAEIQRPLSSIPKLSATEGRKLITIAIAALAARHRETLHFNYANPDEVFLADVGKGTSIAIFGLREPSRYPLECTMGFLILSNGVPIGYGGSSIIFRQANTGVNMFDEYRGSEAAYLWLQVMRVYHQLVGCTRFIANPFQVGAKNDEALKSGAYWFYYRLGFRSVSSAIRKLAVREYEKLRRKKGYRSDISTLRRLASCDMHLTLPAARAHEYFDEDWIQTMSMLAAQVLAAAPGHTRAESEASVVKRASKELGIRNLGAWSKFEQDAFRRLAPIVVAIEPSSWPADERRLTRKTLRARGGTLDSKFARLLSQNEFLFSKLKEICR